MSGVTHRASSVRRAAGARGGRAGSLDTDCEVPDRTEALDELLRVDNPRTRLAR